MEFTVGADLDAAVSAVIDAIGDGDWRPYDGGYIAETVHSMERTKKAFRLIVVRRPVQGDLFDGKGARVRYKAIASNRIETAEETVQWYNARGEPYPKSGDGTLPVGFEGRMGGIGSLFEPPGGRRRQKRPRERPDRRPIKTNRGFRAVKGEQ